MFNIIDLTGKKILITGASSGIGKETALLCSKIGAKVFIVARREEELKNTLAEMEGEGHRYYAFDLSDLDGIEELIKRIVRENGALDGFVHSAGIANTRPFVLLRTVALNEVMHVNFSSFIEISRCITKKGFFNYGMSIVGISSVASLIGTKCKTAYAASKAAMNAAIRCMAIELHSKGIRANTVMPSFIETDMYTQFEDSSGDSDNSKSIIKRQYLGIGETIDVANAVVYLLSDASKFITGTALPVDGGKLSS